MSSPATRPAIAAESPPIPMPSNDSPLSPPAFISRRLASLIAEHDDLDSAISALLLIGNCDDLLIARLKKRKLALKDEIALAGR